jgi:hypothetical protein
MLIVGPNRSVLNWSPTQVRRAFDCKGNQPPEASLSCLVMDSSGMSGPWPMPGHGVCVRADAHEASDSRFSGQNGHVRHWLGLDLYSRQPASPGRDVRSRNTQSYPCSVRSSRRLQRPFTLRAYVLRNVASSIPNAAAMARHSGAENHTAPGGPVQQLPHCVHSN